MFGKWTQRGVVEEKYFDYHDTIDKFYVQHEIVVLKVALIDEKPIKKLNFREMLLCVCFIFACTRENAE